MTQRHLVYLLVTLACFTGVAHAADFGAPAAPSLGYSGNVSFAGGYVSTRSNFGGAFINDMGSLDFAALGRVSQSLKPGVTAQVDAWTDTAQVEVHEGAPTSQTPSFSASGLAGHLYWRLGNAATGGLISIGNLSNAKIWYGNFALEGMQSRGRLVAYVQGGYTVPIGGSDRPGAEQSLYGEAVLRMFVNPDLMLEANAGVARTTHNASNAPTAVLYRWGAAIEHKLPDRPMSLYAEYQGFWDGPTNQIEGGIGFYKGNTVLAGVRFLVNEPTLQARTLTGAAWSDYNALYGVNHQRQ